MTPAQLLAFRAQGESATSILESQFQPFKIAFNKVLRGTEEVKDAQIEALDKFYSLTQKSEG